MTREQITRMDGMPGRFHIGQTLRATMATGGLVAIALVGLACGDDDGDAVDPDDGANGAATAPGDENGDGDLQERFDDLQQQIDALPDESQDAVQELWNETESTFESWESATDEERAELREEFEENAAALEELLGSLGSDSDSEED